MGIAGTLIIIIAAAILTGAAIVKLFERDSDFKTDNKKIYEDLAYYRGYEDALQDMRNLLNRKEPPVPPTTGSNAVKPKTIITSKEREGE